MMQFSPSDASQSMSSPLLAHVDLSQLVLVDIQTKLLAVMQADAMHEVLNNCIRLAKASDLLTVPVIMTEQYPKGLGGTEPTLLQSASPVKPIEKSLFRVSRRQLFLSN